MIKTIFTRVSNRLSTFSIKKQLFIIYVPLIFLATIVIGSFLVIDSTNQLIQNYKHLAVLNTQRVKSTIFNTTNTFQNTAAMLSNDLELRDLLTENYLNEQDAILAINNYRVIDSIRDLQSSISNLNIYTTNQSIPNYKYFKQVDEKIRQTDWYQKASAQSSAFWITNSNESSPNQLFLYKSLPLPLSNEKAILEIQLDYNFLSNQLRTSSYTLEIQLNDDPIFYHDNLKNIGNTPSIKLSKDTFASESMQKIKNSWAIASMNSLRLLNTSDKIYIYSFDYHAFNNLKANMILWSSIVIATLFSTLLIMLMFTRFFSNRVQKLQTAVYYASIEDYEQLQDVSGKDEISQISLDFHKVIQRIKQKEEELYHSRMLEQELLNKQQNMEYKLLASQINPHFLFNTLETIRMMSLKSGNSDAAYAIKLLGKSIRYTLEIHGTKMTTLEKDLEFVHTYIRIQRMRFGERVNYSCKIANDIVPYQVDMLPLLIQPLIENAITHGLEKLTSNGYIKLTIEKNNRDIIIKVIDNGVGITPTELAELQEKIQFSSSSSSENIGLSNVNYRAKMFYGESYGLTIESTQGKGTTITLNIRLLETVGS